MAAGCRPENTAKISRRWWLIFAGFAAVNAILFALNDDWLMVIAFGLLTITELVAALFPDLPDRLRTRPG